MVREAVATRLVVGSIPTEASNKLLTRDAVLTDITLKDGTTTADIRLDRLKQFDEKSRSFRAIRGLETRRRRGFTWRTVKWLNQGMEGACVGFAFGHDAIARPSPLLYVDDAMAREKIYHRAQVIDPWEGGSYPGATPFYEGTSVLSGAKAAQELGHFENYEWAFSVDEMIMAVGYKGPAVIGVDWYDGMYHTDIDGFIKPVGNIIGGHAILVNSVNVKAGYFGLRNSWGQDWGVNGSCKISFDDMAKLLSQQGEVCIPVKRRKVLQPTI